MVHSFDLEFGPSLARTGFGVGEVRSFYRRAIKGPNMTESEEMHIAIRNEDFKPKPCVYCQINKIKTKAGWHVYSRYHCNLCGVALCTGDRYCFGNYHQQLDNDK